MDKGLSEAEASALAAQVRGQVQHDVTVEPDDDFFVVVVRRSVGDSSDIWTLSSKTGAYSGRAFAAFHRQRPLVHALSSAPADCGRVGRRSDSGSERIRLRADLLEL